MKETQTRHVKGLGLLTVLKVYDMEEDPVLFTCKDLTGVTFLAALAEQTDQKQVWLYAPLSADRHAALEAGSLDVQEAFLNAGQVFKSELFADVSGFWIPSCQVSDMLPLKKPE